MHSFVSLLLVAGLSWKNLVFNPVPAKVYEQPITIPTYQLGNEDINPPLWNKQVYPYPMQDEIGDQKKNKTYKAVYLENEYLEVIVLPEIGGHVYAAKDKTTGKDFIYRNNVLKPELAGLRGAWVAGGIKFNFPFSHSVTTFSRVDYSTRENDDGSVTCFVNNLERVSRMKWLVAITLHPGRSFIEIATTLYNHTAEHHPYSFWANAAIPATEDLQFIYPVQIGTSDDKQQVINWPIDHDVDISWYKNYADHFSFFGVNVKKNFFGAYYHNEDKGIVHVADYRECPGKGLESWGTAPQGMILEKMLTDNDGQYCEIQSGRFENQNDYGILSPYTVDHWVEYWYPVNGLGGITEANADFCANIELHRDEKPGKFFIALNATAIVKHCNVRVQVDGVNITMDPLSISPEGPYRKWVHVPSDLPDPTCVTLSVEDITGEVLFATSKDFSKKQPDKLNLPPLIPDDEKTTEELYLDGEFYAKELNTLAARSYFEQALKRDPAYAPAHCELGILAYQQGLWAQAVLHFDSALARNLNYNKARYYRGLARKMQGDNKHAEEDFWRLTRNPEYAASALYNLGVMSASTHDYIQAADFWRRAMMANANSFKVRNALCMSLRKLNLIEEGQDLNTDLLSEDPTNHWAVAERYFLALVSGNDIAAAKHKKEVVTWLQQNSQNNLETAIEYASLGCLDEAIVLLLMLCDEQYADHTPPMVYYYLTHFLDKKNEKELANQYRQFVTTVGLDYAFPHRPESIYILEQAVAKNPNDANAHYLLGTLLASKGREEEALRMFTVSDSLGLSYSVLYRNMAEIYRREHGDLNRAAQSYDKAIKNNPNEWRYWVSLDKIFADLGLHHKRRQLFDKAPKEILAQDRIKLSKAIFHIDVKEYGQALKILETNQFKPWQGWPRAHQCFVRAHWERGEQRFLNSDYQGALKDFIATTTYPENLGCGEPPNPQHAKSLFYIGVCYDKLGQKKKAKHYWQRAAAEEHPVWSENNAFVGFAMHALNRQNEAIVLFDGMLEHISQNSLINGQTPNDDYLYGLALMGAGNSSKAKFMFTEILRNDKKFTAVQRELHRMTF